MSAFLRSFRYAAEGIAYMFRTQRNARVHALVAISVVIAAAIFRVSSVEWAVIALAIGLVFGAEAFNSVAELAVDLLTDQYHPMAKWAKDAAAGAVLITALAAVGAGIAIFGPRIWGLLFD